MPVADRKLRVFLCHASQDKPVVRELYQKLAAEGWIEPWLYKDKILPGQQWQVVIEEAVEAADIVIVFLSNHSVQKEGFVQRELRYASVMALEKPESTIFLIPVRVEECLVPRSLRDLQWMNYFGEEKGESYENLLDALNLRYNQVLGSEQGENLRKIIRSENQVEEISPLPMPQFTTLSFESVVIAWKQVINLVKANDANIAALLISGKPLEIHDGTLLIAFASDILQEKFNRPEVLNLTRRAISEALGVDLPVSAIPTLQDAIVSFERVVTAWKQITHLVKAKDSNVAALLNAGKPLEIRNGTLIIAFASNILQEKFNRPETLNLTRQAIHDALGVDLPVSAISTLQAATMSFERVVTAWNQIAHLVKAKDSNVAALLNAGKPLEIRDGTLLIAYTSDILQEKINQPERLELIRKAIYDILGVYLPVLAVRQTSNIK